MSTTTVPESSGRTHDSGRGRLYFLLAIGLPVLTLLALFVILRWAPSPVETAVIVVSILLIVMAVVGYLGSRRGVVAPFVAVALILPYLLGAVVAYGGAQRAEAELYGLFSDDGFSDGGDPGAGTPREDEVAAENIPPVPFGEAGHFEGFAVVIESVECGVRSIRKAMDNPEYYDSDSAPEFISATPPEGKMFCIIHSSWTNDSNEADSRSPYQTITGLVGTDGRQYSMIADDESVSGNLTRTKSGYDEETLNPGDAANIYSVFSVPNGTEPETLVAEGYAMDSTEVVYFDAKSAKGDTGEFSTPSTAEDFKKLLNCTSFDSVKTSDGPADEEYNCTTEGIEIVVMRMPVVVGRDIATSMADSGMFSLVFDTGWLISSEEPGPLGAVAEGTGEVLVEPQS